MAERDSALHEAEAPGWDSGTVALRARLRVECHIVGCHDGVSAAGLGWIVLDRWNELQLP
jgi:hypothetical protein